MSENTRSADAKLIGLCYFSQHYYCAQQNSACKMLSSLFEHEFVFFVTKCFSKIFQFMLKLRVAYERAENEVGSFYEVVTIFAYISLKQGKWRKTKLESCSYIITLHKLYSQVKSQWKRMSVEGTFARLIYKSESRSI